MSKQYKHIFKNYWLVVWFSYAILIAVVAAVVLVALDMPLWSVMLMIGLALFFVVLTVVAMVVKSMKIDATGISVRFSHCNRSFYAWGDITAVKISRRKLYLRYITYAYTIELISQDITIKFKCDDSVINKIIKYCMSCESFLNMFVNELNECDKRLV